MANLPNTSHLRTQINTYNATIGEIAGQLTTLNASFDANSTQMRELAAQFSTGTMALDAYKHQFTEYESAMEMTRIRQADAIRQRDEIVKLRDGLIALELVTTKFRAVELERQALETQLRETNIRLLALGEEVKAATGKVAVSSGMVANPPLGDIIKLQTFQPPVAAQRCLLCGHCYCRLPTNVQ